MDGVRIIRRVAWSQRTDVATHAAAVVSRSLNVDVETVFGLSDSENVAVSTWSRRTFVAPGAGARLVIVGCAFGVVTVTVRL